MIVSYPSIQWKEAKKRVDKDQLRDLITKVLKDVDLYSESAVELLMLTAATESKLGHYIRQVGGGPALGIFQMEPSTEDDIWDNYIYYKSDEFANSVSRYATELGGEEMEWNLAYQIIMARIHYLRVKDPLPAADDVEGLANYYKKYYNTRLGKATVKGAIEDYHKYAV